MLFSGGGSKQNSLEFYISFIGTWGITFHFTSHAVRKHLFSSYPDGPSLPLV